MRALSAYDSESQSLGYFRIFAKPPGGRKREITLFRNAPVRVDRVSFSDPFTDQSANLSLPQVTVWDHPGEGDLDWLVPDSDIDIVFQNTGSYDFDWRWEGYVASFGFSLSGTESSFSCDLKGAFYGLDDYLAIPSHPRRPIPYEILMAMAFDQKEHPSRLGQFRILFPEDWELTVPEFKDPEYLSFLKPWGVHTGQRWTGFTSRSTGTWEPLLTGHVQSLLTVMFAEGGAQWSIRNRGHRRPELYLRTIPDPDHSEIIDIVLGAPGVDFNGSQDWTQRASVIFGQGVDDAGISYSGMTVAPDGKTTLYKPFAYSPVVWPRSSNPNLNSSIKPKETMIRFQDGMDQVSAIKVAQGQLQRFSEPGITGTVTLTSDPRYSSGQYCPRLLMQAGCTIRLKGLFGLPEGITAHVTQVEVDLDNLSTTLTYDTKYRDQLTVDEVKARTRDALTPLRALQVGKYSNTVQDLVLPWSYSEGSGCVPLGAKEFFNEKLPSTAEFPYEEWTKKYPPKNASSRPYYVRINPTVTTDSSKNWSGVPRDGSPILSIPIRMGQNGVIRLSQIAAYDKDGNVLPVRFHVSVYGLASTGIDAMPKFPVDPGPASAPVIPFLRPKNITVNYKVGQSNPFFKEAWETVRENGQPFTNEAYLTAKGADVIVGWGNYYEPAGYSPGRASKGAARTGLLEDNASWSFDTEKSSNLDMLNPSNNATLEYAGMLFVNIFCDEQGDQPVYFLGRFFRQEPGTQ